MFFWYPFLELDLTTYHWIHVNKWIGTKMNQARYLWFHSLAIEMCCSFKIKWNKQWNAYKFHSLSIAFIWYMLSMDHNVNIMMKGLALASSRIWNMQLVWVFLANLATCVCSHFPRGFLELAWICHSLSKQRFSFIVIADYIPLLPPRHHPIKLTIDCIVVSKLQATHQ
jgi:hypothetical protein